MILSIGNDREMKSLALTPAQQRRIQRLAREAGRSPRQMMRFVLRDGLEFCEWAVRESLATDEDVQRRGAVSNDVAMRQAREVVAAAYAKRPRKAA